MSDYMYLLESHLSAEQNRVVAEVQAAAGTANVNLFLTGGAMRDMLGGSKIKDLDFTVEGNALKLAKAVASKTGARAYSVDEHRRSVELVFGSGVTAEIAMAREEQYTRSGARPQVTPAHIQEDLRRRDFTVNAIALSLNRASRGLLVDPANGLADLMAKQLRASQSTAMMDDPSRLLRLVRLRVRLGFQVEERTQRQYENARAAELQKSIPRRKLFDELRQIAAEPNGSDILRELEREGLLAIFSPALAGAKLNLLSLAKLEKIRRLQPPGDGFKFDGLALFLYVLTEKLSGREKAELIKGLEMRRSEIESWQKLEAKAKKLEQALKSPRLRQPYQIYQVLSQAPGEEILLALYRSQNRLAQDRIKNYLQKYHAAAQEVSDAEVQAAGGKAGTPKYVKIKEELIAAKLNGRARKVPPPVEIAAAPQMENRSQYSRARMQR